MKKLCRDLLTYVNSVCIYIARHTRGEKCTYLIFTPQNSPDRTKLNKIAFLFTHSFILYMRPTERRCEESKRIFRRLWNFDPTKSRDIFEMLLHSFIQSFVYLCNTEICKPLSKLSNFNWVNFWRFLGLQKFLKKFAQFCNSILAATPNYNSQN